MENPDPRARLQVFEFEGSQCLYRDHLGRRVVADMEGSPLLASECADLVVEGDGSYLLVTAPEGVAVCGTLSIPSGPGRLEFLMGFDVASPPASWKVHNGSDLIPGPPGEILEHPFRSGVWPSVLASPALGRGWIRGSLDDQEDGGGYDGPPAAGGVGSASPDTLSPTLSQGEREHLGSRTVACGSTDPEGITYSSLGSQTPGQEGSPSDPEGVALTLRDTQPPHPSPLSLGSGGEGAENSSPREGEVPRYEAEGVSPFEVQNPHPVRKLSGHSLQTGRGSELARLIFSHLNEASFTVHIPEETEGLILLKLYDRFHGRQRARVLVDVQDTGIWYEPVQDRENRWAWGYYGIPSQYLKKGEEQTIRIDPPSGTPLWSVSRLEVWNLLRPLQ